MDADTFEEIVSEERYSRYSPKRDNYDNLIEVKLKYKPYIECPRCSNWQLAARVHKKRHTVSKGFLRGSDTEWRLVERWWECSECGGTFDVTSGEESELYELTLIDGGGSNAEIPVDGGEKGIILRQSNVVRVPTASAKFQLPDGEKLPKRTEVRIKRQGNDVYCVEES